MGYLNVLALHVCSMIIMCAMHAIDCMMVAFLYIKTNPSNIGTLMEGNVDPSDADDIMRTLLDHETKSTSTSRNDSEDSDLETFQKPSISQQGFPSLHFYCL